MRRGKFIRFAKTEEKLIISLEIGEMQNPYLLLGNDETVCTHDDDSDGQSVTLKDHTHIPIIGESQGLSAERALVTCRSVDSRTTSDYGQVSLSRAYSHSNDQRRSCLTETKAPGYKQVCHLRRAIFRSEEHT